MSPSLCALPSNAVVVHGGMHKTGSSALQNTLADHRDTLREAGWLYPDAGLVLKDETGRRHRALMVELRKGQPGSVGAALTRELAAWPHRVIVSHENFYSPQIDPRLLVEAMGGRPVVMLAYVRHPVDYLESCWREWVRRWRCVDAPRDFYQSRRDYFELEALSERWRAALGEGQLVLRPYDRRLLPGGSVVEDFVALLGLEGLGLVASATTNDSLTADQALVYREANRLRARPDRRDQLAALLADVALASRWRTALLEGAVPDGLCPDKARALCHLLDGVGTERRFVDDELASLVEASHLAAWASALHEHGCDSGAPAWTSRAWPVETRLNDAHTREAIVQLLA